MKRHEAVRSIFGSLRYAPSFYDDFVALQGVIEGPPERHKGMYGPALADSSYFTSVTVAKHSRKTLAYAPKKTKRLHSSTTRRRIRQLLRRIGLSKCKCIIPRIRQRELGVSIKPIRLPIFELHCPNVRRATASYTESATTSSDFKVEISLIGSGTSFGASYTEKTIDEISVRNGMCCQIVRETQLVVRKVSYVCDKCKSNTETKFIFGLSPASDELIPIAIRRNKDGCRKSPKEMDPDEYRAIPVPARVAKKKSLTVSVGSECNSSLGISVPSLNMQGKVFVKAMRDIRYEYLLVGPRVYYSYPVDGLNRYWTSSMYRQTTRPPALKEIVS